MYCKKNMNYKNSIWFAPVTEFAKNIFNHAKGSHGWDHTQRVVRLCINIGTFEKADMDILLCAAYLHDIGRTVNSENCHNMCHGEIGAEMAEPVICKLFNKQKKDNILHCIRSHRFRGNSIPCSNEAKVLFDADKIDAIGAIGIARAYLFAGEIGSMLHNPDHDISNARSYTVEDTGFLEYKVKLVKIKDRMLTAAGKELACERHKFMEQFFKRFISEYEGKQ